VLLLQLAREGGLGEHLRAGPAHRADAADVVKMPVGEDQVGDRLAGRKPDLPERGGHPRRRRSGVDRHHAVAGRDDREVAEVVALSDVHAGFRPPDPGRGEPEAVLGVRPVTAEQHAGVGREGVEPRVPQRLGRAVVPAERGVSGGEAPVHGANQLQRELAVPRKCRVSLLESN
jgi:hypothetical protein